MDSVIVLGAGLAGLGCARHLPGCRVFEAANHPGGRVYSHPMDGVHFDQGAHISHSKDDAFIAMTTAAAGDVVTTETSVVRNHWNKRWIGYPVQNNLSDLPLEQRVEALIDLVAAQSCPAASDPADYRAWCLAQYGTYLTKTFYDLFTHKYWRVPTDHLATDWLGGRLLPSQLPRIIRGAFGVPEPSQAVFARFRYPARGGFFRFFESLDSDVDIAYNERAVEIDVRKKRVSFASGRTESYDSLVSTIPLPVVVSLIADAPAELVDAASKLRHTQLLCVNMIVNRPKLADCHWFYIYDGDVEAARVSVPSNLAPGSLPPGRSAIQAEVFRRCDETFDPASLAEKAAAQMGKILGFAPADVRTMGHVLVPRAYVISDHHRAAAVNAIRTWLDERDIHTAGLYGRWKYIWSDEAYRQGREIGERLQSRQNQRKVA